MADILTSEDLLIRARFYFLIDEWVPGAICGWEFAEMVLRRDGGAVEEFLACVPNVEEVGVV